MTVNSRFAMVLLSALVWTVACRQAHAQNAQAPGTVAPPPAAKQGSKPGSKAPALPDVPANIDEMLAIALRSNPEILQAEARVRKAQADLNQVRLKATQEVITAFAERTKEEQTLVALAEQEERMKKMIEVGKAPTDAASEILGARVSAEARLAQNLAQLRYSLGLGGSIQSAGSEAQPAPGRREPLRRPEISREFKQVLAKEVSVNFDQKPLGEVIQSLKELSDNQLFPMIDRAAPIDLTHLLNREVTLSLSRVPLRVLLVALSDQYYLCFVFREYGFLVTIPPRAEKMYAPVIPEETPLKLE